MQFALYVMRYFETDACACIRRHQDFALAPVRERRVRVYTEAPGFRPAPRAVARALLCHRVACVVTRTPSVGIDTRSIACSSFQFHSISIYRVQGIEMEWNCPSQVEGIITTG
jgi:hypothetical protein